MDERLSGWTTNPLSDSQHLPPLLPSAPKQTTERLFVYWLLNFPATCLCISGTDLLRQFYVLPHWDRSCRSNCPSHPVTVYWHQAIEPQNWPYTARHLAGQPLECQFLSHWYDSTPEKSRRKRDLNPGSSALEADAVATRSTRRYLPRARARAREKRERERERERVGVGVRRLQTDKITDIDTETEIIILIINSYRLLTIVHRVDLLKKKEVINIKIPAQGKLTYTHILTGCANSVFLGARLHAIQDVNFTLKVWWWKT